MSLPPSKRRRVSPPDEEEVAIVKQPIENLTNEDIDEEEDEDPSQPDMEEYEEDGDDVGSEELDEELGDEEGIEEDGMDNDHDQDEEGGDEDEDEDEAMEEEEEEEDHRAAVVPKQANPVTDTAPPSRPSNRIAVSGTGAHILKLQIEDMLKNARPTYGAKEAPAEELLRKLKSVIENIPDRESVLISHAEQAMLRQKIVIPFPDFRPPTDAQYKLGFVKPSSVNVSGSYALKTGTRVDGLLTLDLVVTMPTSLFTEKDYLDYRYFHKRAFYLACIAAAVRSSKDITAKVSFSCLNGNELLPTLLIQPATDSEFARSQCDIQIILAMPEGFLPIARTTPNRCSVRTNKGTSMGRAPPTPFYNSSLRADSSVTSYLKLLHGTAARCEGFRDACILGRIWIKQRDIQGLVSRGGFGHFEWAALIALLLYGGGAKGKPVLLPTYDGYQLFRGTLVFLASKDVTKQPLVIGTADSTAVKVAGQPMVYDMARGVNILYKMTASSYKYLQKQAQTSIKMLSGRTDNQFESTFTTRVSEPLMQYDLLGEVHVSGERLKQSAGELSASSEIQQVYNLLMQGLGNRISLVNVTSSERQAWSVDAARPSQMNKTFSFGLLLDSTHASRAVERGPSAEEPQAAATFREFWGDKAELRRFKDGSILESVIWKSTSTVSLTKEVVSYIIQRHLDSTCTFVGNAFESVPGAQHILENTTAFEHLREAYRTLENDIRSLEGLPLSIRQFQAASPLLRSSSTLLPFSENFNKEDPAAVVIQFEGSGRWPDDLHAIQMTKIAFLLKIDQLISNAHPNLTTKVGLENADDSILNRSFLDIIYPSSAAFRLRIHHEREQTLIERRLANKTLPPKGREEAATALAVYKREFVRNPLHTQAIQTLSTRLPALSPTIRLAKIWFNAHLLSTHFPPELIEIIVAHTFLQPYPWTSPSTPQTGLLRTLHFLSTWDWRSTPLLLDFSDAPRADDLEATRTRFEAWRKLDPLMNRVVLFVASNYANEGTTWTEYTPSKVVASRMTSLARAAVKAVQAQGISLDLGELFRSALKDFDFVVHLTPRFGRRGPVKQSKSKYKNLVVAATADPDVVGYDPVQLFYDELQRLFGDSMVFFRDENGMDRIAGLWSPHTARRKWKVNLGYSSVPAESVQGAEEEVDVDVNKDAILGEIARLGGDMVAKIERNR